MASIYKRGRVWWTCYMENGRKFDKSLKTKDSKVAQYKKNEIELRLAFGDSPPPNTTITVNDAFAQFKEHRHGRIVAKTKQTDDYRIERFIADENLLRLSQITEQRLKQHLDKRIKAGISHRTANHTIRIIKTFLNWALRNKLVATNHIANMQRYRIDTVEPKFLTGEQVRAVLGVFKPTRIYLLVAAAVYTGARLSELGRLEWEDIDFDRKIIKIKLSKAGRFRDIPLHQDLREILLPNKATGKCFSMVNASHIFNDHRAKAGVGHFRFHDLRHTFASLLIKSGVDIYTVSKLLGHSQVTTTQIYSHLYQDHAQEAMGKLKLQ